MDYLPIDNILIANGDFTPLKAYGPGRHISIELTGTFDGATVAVGFTSSDSAPVFIADVNESNVALSATAPRRFYITKPASGLPALRVSAVGASTAILVKIVELSR